MYVSSGCYHYSWMLSLLSLCPTPPKTCCYFRKLIDLVPICIWIHSPESFSLITRRSHNTIFFAAFHGTDVVRFSFFSFISNRTITAWRKILRYSTAINIFLPPVISAWTSANYRDDPALSKFAISAALGSGLGVAVESMGLISYQKAYRQVVVKGNSTEGVTYPLMMAVINVAKGKVTVSSTFRLED